MTSFTVHAIEASDLETLRSKGTDAAGHPLVPAVAGGGEALRCCLRCAVTGEPILLFGWAPPLPPSPYREVGPVYVHAQPCAGPVSTGYPDDYRGRVQALRAYDRRGWIHDATRVNDGVDPEGAIADMFADPTVVQVHSRNIAWGCWMFRVTRAG